MPRVTPPDAPSRDGLTPIVTGGDDASMTALRDALAEAEKRAAEAERRAAVAEAVAAERERVIKAQAMALRLLEPPKIATAVEPSPAPVMEASEEARRPWWRRRQA